MKIDFTLYPYKLSLKRREPIQLKVTLTNPSDSSKLISLEILTPRTLSIDKSGYKNYVVERFDNFEGKKAVTKYFDIYPKVTTRLGEDFIIIRVLEHYDDYTFIQRTLEKKVPISIIQ